MNVCTKHELNLRFLPKRFNFPKTDNWDGCLLASKYIILYVNDMELVFPAALAKVKLLSPRNVKLHFSPTFPTLSSSSYKSVLKR